MYARAEFQDIGHLCNLTVTCLNVTIHLNE